MARARAPRSEDWKARLIAQSFMFRDLAPELLNRIVELSRVQRFRRGAAVFHIGDEGNALYGVSKGLVRIWLPGKEGRELTISLLDPGEIFGEIALLDGLPRTAEATVLSEAVLIALDRPLFLNLLRQEPQLAQHIIELLCKRLRTSTDRFSEDAFLSLGAKLARRLLSLMATHSEPCTAGSRITMRLTQTDLANLLGSSRETINRQLGLWSQTGIIRHERGYVTVCNQDALRQIAT
jgi:CRP/FNR family cyclic AMP-dependent transcriptional regulator